MSIIHDLVESLPNQALVSVTDGALEATSGGHACSPEFEDFQKSSYSQVERLASLYNDLATSWI